METDWFAIGESVIATALGAALGAVGSLAVHLYRREKKHDEKRDAEHAALMAGMRELMRSQLYDMHTRYVVHGDPMPYDEKERAESVYRTYHSLGGNGTGTHVYNELMSAYVGGMEGTD